DVKCPTLSAGNSMAHGLPGGGTVLRMDAQHGLFVADRAACGDAEHAAAGIVPRGVAGLKVIVPTSQIGSLQSQSPLLPGLPRRFYLGGAVVDPPLEVLVEGSDFLRGPRPL